MGNLGKIFISIFILISCFLIIFFCPVTVHVTTYSNNSFISANYSYEDNRQLWNMDGDINYYQDYPLSMTPRKVSSTETPEINWGKLLLEEFCILGLTFVIYLIAKKYIII